jgi:predicted GNAT superfamily acetyltransferase
MTRLSPNETENVQIRSLNGETDYSACVELQQHVWGDEVGEIVPPAVMLVSQKIGGIAAGAFDANGELVGFVFGLTGIMDGRLVHWSHLLAVRPESRDRGIGGKLKLYQRDRLRDMGVTALYWTFDPLEARNAWLNLNRLGARVIEYAPHMYGEAATAKTDGIIGTDRFVVCWDTQDHSAPTDATRPESAPVFTIGSEDSLTDTGSVQSPEIDPRILVEIPINIQLLKLEDPATAVLWREATRSALTRYLGMHYVVRCVVLDSARTRAFYLLETGGQLEVKD